MNKIIEHVEKPKHITVPTGFLDMNKKEIFIGDICVGKNDRLHPLQQVNDQLYEAGLERDYVRKNGSPHVQEFIWGGTFLKSVAPNLLKVGNIFDNPELLLEAEW